MRNKHVVAASKLLENVLGERVGEMIAMNRHSQRTIGVSQKLIEYGRYIRKILCTYQCIAYEIRL